MAHHLVLPRVGAVEGARGGRALGLKQVVGGKSLVEWVARGGVGVGVVHGIALRLRGLRFFIRPPAAHRNPRHTVGHELAVERHLGLRQMRVFARLRQTESAVSPRHEGLAVFAARAPAVGVLPFGIDGEEILQRSLAIFPLPLVLVAHGAELLLAVGVARA